MADDIVINRESQAAEPTSESRSLSAGLSRKLKGKGPIVAFGACLVVAAMLVLWQYQRTGLRGPRKTVSIGLTSEELIALRKLIGPLPSNPDKYRRGTFINIGQVRDVEERLSALETAIPLGDSLSAAANNDLRVLQPDIKNMEQKQTFLEQLVKEQRAELSDEFKLSIGIMVMVNLAILAFFWQVVRSRN